MSGSRMAAQPVASPPRRVWCRTDDLDRARAFCRDLYPRLDLYCCGPASRFSFSFEAVRLGPVTVGLTRVGVATRLEADALDVGYHVSMPLSGAVESEHRNIRVTADPTCAAVFRPVGRGVMRLPTGCALLCVEVERHALENHLEWLLGQPGPAPIRLAASLDVAHGAGLSWARIVRLLGRDLGNQNGLAYQPLMAEGLQHAVLTGLLLAVEHPHREELAHNRMPHRPRTVKRAIDAMRANPAHPFTATDLADLAGIGRRALQEGFRQHVGVSPMTYLRHLRLELARGLLRQSGSPEWTVAEVASRCGFRHLGRFAAAYRAKYGVLPSRTRREEV